MSGKAEDAANLTIDKDDNAAWRQKNKFISAVLGEIRYWSFFKKEGVPDD